MVCPTLGRESTERMWTTCSLRTSLSKHHWKAAPIGCNASALAGTWKLCRCCFLTSSTTTPQNRTLCTASSERHWHADCPQLVAISSTHFRPSSSCVLHGGRGLMSMKNLSRGDVILSVPTHILFSVENANKTELAEV